MQCRPFQQSEFSLLKSFKILSTKSRLLEGYTFPFSLQTSAYSFVIKLMSFLSQLFTEMCVMRLDYLGSPVNADTLKNRDDYGATGGARTNCPSSTLSSLEGQYFPMIIRGIWLFCKGGLMLSIA